jgi:hypothetical protein
MYRLLYLSVLNHFFASGVTFLQVVPQDCKDSGRLGSGKLQWQFTRR